MHNLSLKKSTRTMRRGCVTTPSVFGAGVQNTRGFTRLVKHRAAALQRFASTAHEHFKNIPNKHGRAQMRHTARCNTTGFTLIELLVSVFIFSIVMTISMGSLMVLIDANKKGQGVQAVMSNISFALDSMTRNIRTGSGYYCGSGSVPDPLPDDEATRDCSGGDYIIYTNSRTDERIAYRHNTGDGTIERKVAGEGWLPLTASELFIETFSVAVSGSDQFDVGDIDQPTARMLIEGYIVSDGDTDTDFRLQTDITQRILDF